MTTSFTDQLNRTIKISFPPKRIVSLVPSQTELLYSLGLDEEVVGITKFCKYPAEWFKLKTRIGGTKTANIERIKSLQPDIIIANKEENVQEQIEVLQGIAPVWVSDITTLQEATGMIQSVGDLVNRSNAANTMADEILNRFQHIPLLPTTKQSAYLIWKNPYMAAGEDTFIHHMMTRCGFKNIFSHYKRYPETSVKQLAELNCELLLLSSEPFPFKAKHIKEIQQQLPNTKIILVDGEMFSWYGSRLLHAAEYLTKMLLSVNAS